MGVFKCFQRKSLKFDHVAAGTSMILHISKIPQSLSISCQIKISVLCQLVCFINLDCNGKALLLSFPPLPKPDLISKSIARYKGAFSSVLDGHILLSLCVHNTGELLLAYCQLCVTLKAQVGAFLFLFLLRAFCPSRYDLSRGGKKRREEKVVEKKERWRKKALVRKKEERKIDTWTDAFISFSLLLPLSLTTSKSDKENKILDRTQNVL